MFPAFADKISKKISTTLQPPNGKDLKVDGIIRQGHHGKELQEAQEEDGGHGGG
jgi:hypothetical protein